MELIKKNVHMDREKCNALTQLTLDEDYNIPDTKPDIYKIILENGGLKIDEAKASEGHCNVKGELLFTVLYLTDTPEKGIAKLYGSIPFEEFVHMDGVDGGDAVSVRGDVEDLTIGIINSRKMSIQAIATLKLCVEELYDTETTVEVTGQDSLEYCSKPMDVMEIAVQKKDIYRIREEVELPSNLPNIFEILWDDAELGPVEMKPLDGKVSVQGEMTVFFLYEAEGEDARVQWYEARVPFSGTVDCHGCSEGMVSDIRVTGVHKELEVKPDYDGEERVIAVDMVLDLNIKLYGETHIDLLSDIYGVTKEVGTKSSSGVFRKLLMKNRAKCRGSERVRIRNTGPRILQLCHAEGKINIDETRVTENGIEVTGAVEAQILYVTSDDSMSFFSMKGSIPFEQIIDIPGISPASSYHIESSLEQLATNMIDSEEIEVKVLLNLEALVFDNLREDIITDITLSDLDENKLKDLPGIVGYIVKEGDTLWQIGKKYYVSIEQMKAMNDLTGTEIRPGDKLLIVKTLDKK